MYSCGCSLSADELYKVDKTVLAEVISAERQKLHKDKKDKKEDKTREEGKESEEKDIQDEELVELEQILRACDDIQQNTQKDEDYLTGENILIIQVDVHHYMITLFTKYKMMQ